MAEDGKVRIFAELDDSEARKKVESLSKFIQTQLTRSFSNIAAPGDGIAKNLQAIKSAVSSAGNASQKATRSLKTLDNELDDVSDSSKKLASDIDKLISSFSASTVQVIKATSSLTRYGNAVLDAGRDAGLTSNEMIELARRTGILSNEQADAVSNARNFEQAIEALSESLKQGKISQDVYITSVQRMAKAFGVNLTTAAEKAEKELREFSAQTVKTEARVSSLGAEILDLAASAETADDDIVSLAKKMGILSREQEKSARNAIEFRQKIEELKESLRKGDISVSEFANSTKNLSRSLGVDLTKSAQQTTFSLGNIEKAFLKVQSVLFFLREAVQLFKQGFEFAQEGARVEQTRISFQRFAEEIIGVPDALEQLRTAARGTITDMELMSSTLTLVAGTTPELSRTLTEAISGTGDFEIGLLQVARAAQILNPSLGDVDFFLKSLSVGIKRNSIRWIDNTGILISTREAYDKYAESVGKSILALTEDEKRIAVLNETLRVGALLVEQVGGEVESLTDPFQRATTNVTEFTQELQKSLSEAVLPAIQGFNQFADLLSGKYSSALTETADASIELATATEKTKEEQIAALRELEASTAQVIGERPILAPLFFGEEIAQTRVDIATQLAGIASDAEEFTELYADIFGDAAPEASQALVGSLIENADILEGIDAEGLGIEELFFEVNQQLAEQEGALQAAQLAAAPYNAAMQQMAQVQAEAEESARELEQAQRDLRRNLEGVSDEIIGKQIGAYKQLAEAQAELATATGDGIEEAGQRVADISSQIAENYREMAANIFANTDVSEEAAVRFQASLGLIDDATANNILNVRQVSNAMEDLFVLVATDPSLSSLANDYDTLAAAAVLLTTGQIDLAQGMNEAALEALAQVEGNEALIQSLLKVDAGSQKTKNSQDELADAIRQVTIEAIKGASDLTSYGNSILTVLEGANLSSEELIDLAEATGLLSAEQARTARVTQQFNARLRELEAALKAGTISEREMLNEAIALANALGIDLTGAAMEATQAALDMSRAFGTTFVQELSKSSSQLSSAGSAMASVTEQADLLNRQLGKYFAEALQAEEATDNWTLRLFELASESGASADQLAILAAATGEFSDEEIQNALAAAQMEAGIQRIVEAMVNGQISAEQAQNAIGGMQQQLEETGQIDLGALGIPTVTREAERASGAAREAKDETAQWAKNLLQLAADGGASAQEIAILSIATGEFSEASVRAALKAAIMQQAVAKVAQAFIDGKVSAQEAVDIIRDFEDSLDGDFSLSIDDSSISDTISLIDELENRLNDIPDEVDVNVNINARGDTGAVPDAGIGSGGGAATPGGGFGDPGGGAPGTRLHTGGVVTGTPGVEVPAILLPGEGVIRASAMTEEVEALVNTLNRNVPMGFREAVNEALGNSLVTSPTTQINNTTNINTTNSNSTQITNNNFAQFQSVDAQPITDIGAV